MADGLHPTDGVRVQLELEAGRSDGADYVAGLFTPTEHFAYRVSIAADKSVTVTTSAAVPAPEPLVDLLRKIARGVANDGLAERDPAWPRKILRWRAR